MPHVVLGCQVSVWEDDFEGSAVGFLGPGVFGGPDVFWRFTCILGSQVSLGGLGVFWSIRCVLGINFEGSGVFWGARYV